MIRLYSFNLGDELSERLWINEKTKDLNGLNGEKPIILTEDKVSEKYKDITTISNLGEFARYSGKSCFYVKKCLEEIYQNNWEELSFFEKKTLSEHFVVDNNKIIDTIGVDGFNENNHFKIYHYLNDDVLNSLTEEDFKTTPKSIDYKKSIKKRLHPKLNFDKFGFLVEVLYYSDLNVDDSGPIAVYNYENPIVKYEANYNTGSDGYTINRVTKRSWTLNSGEWSDDIKESIKIYDPITSRNESKRRRRNLINNLLVEIVGIILMVSPNLKTTNEAEIDAMAFFHDIETSITAYYESGTTVDKQGNPCKLVKEISQHPYDKLDVNIPFAGVTLRGYLLSRINPQ